MNIRDQLIVLAEIGRIDAKLKELDSKMASLPIKSQEANKQATIKEQAEQAFSSSHQQLLAQRKELDAALLVERGNLRKWEGRAEKIKGEREYSALISEINTQKKTISKIEEQLAQNHRELAAVEKDLTQATEEMQVYKQLSAEEMDKVRANLDTLQEEKQGLLKNRESLTAQLPIAINKRYQQVRDRRAGQGIAIVSREVCQACKRMLPPEMYIQIMKSEVLETCPSCQRILVAENLTQVKSE